MAAPDASRRGRAFAALIALALAVAAGGEPGLRPSALPNCKDNKNYLDLWNSTCADWRGENCFAAEDWTGYSQAEQEELIQQCPDSCGVCRMQEWQTANRAADICREALAKDSACCLDKIKVARVQRVKLRRPGTDWNCTELNCYDEVQGPRGEDILWVPDAANCQTPRLVYLHGGSWEYGSPRTDGYEVLVPKLARAGGVVALAIDYPLSPAARYPQMLDATLKALEYLATHGPPGCINEPERAPPLFIAGDSSGGGLAYSALLSVHSGQRSLHGGRVSLAGAFFFSPWLNMRCDTSTYLNNAYSKRKLIRGRVSHAGDIAFQDSPEKSVADALENALEYLGSRELLDDPVASPYNAGPEMLKGLPPLLFAVASNELIMGDTVIAAQKAARAEVDVVLDIYDAMWHDFPMYSDGCGSGEPLWSAQRALRRTGRFLRDVAITGRSPCRTRATEEGLRALGVPVTNFYIQGTHPNHILQASSDGFPCARGREEGMLDLIFAAGGCTALLTVCNFAKTAVMFGISILVALLAYRRRCCRGSSSRPSVQ